ncbi:MAG TPA: AraC family transcriptional regulator [Puia sp.]|nr:AraC family transcriptional regulator [Puia sp.]
MPLLFNRDQQTTFYRNPISLHDLNSSVLVESHDTIRLDHAGMTFQNWCFGGFRLAYSVLGQQQETSYDIRNDIDAVKIYFNRSGRTRIDYHQLSKTFSLRGGQCNMLYSAELDSRMSHVDNHSEMFSLQITREGFLGLIGEGDDGLDRFIGKTVGRQAALYSDTWFPMNAAMEKCIDEVLHCPFERDMKTIYLRSKALELFVLFAHSGANMPEAVAAGSQRNVGPKPLFGLKPQSGTELLSGTKKISGRKLESEKERLYFVKDHLIQNYANPNSLSALAKVSGLNEFKLKKGFRELFKTSVMDFLISYRLEMARDLLLNTGKNISEVAYETGYASPAYFGKAFKKKYGVSPKKLG